MTVSLRVARRANIVDEVRLERCRRLPELGPRLLFFSGGSALRGLARRIKLYTTNSIHLVTPFDSGGSSALLRSAFRMPAVGDLRNRLIALADETERGNPEVYRLFSHRFEAGADPAALGGELLAMVRGEHVLVAEVPSPLRRLIRTHLRMFAERMPEGFDLRRASVGNLILAGGYLNNERDIESTLFLFSRLVQARGSVALTVEADHHLAAELADGSVVVGQHLLNGRDGVPLPSAITSLSLVDSLEDPKPVEVDIDSRVRHLIGQSDLLVYPMGSFYSSVIANLLPRGVGRAITEVGCPKVFVPNTGTDPEQVGGSVGRAVEELLRYVRRDAGDGVPGGAALDAVVLDERDDAYGIPLELHRIERLGVAIVRVPLVLPGGAGKIDAERLAQVLLSLA